MMHGYRDASRFAGDLRRVRRCLVVAGAAAAAAGCRSRRSAAGTRLIVQTVTVKDKDGKPIEGLTAKDLRVTEDGEPQAIAFVEYQRLHDTGPAPAAGAAAAAPASPIRRDRSRRASVAPDDRRADFVVAARQTSAIATAGCWCSTSTCRPCRRPIRCAPTRTRGSSSTRRWMPPDLVAIMTFQGGAVRVKQDFTDDRGRLREVIQTLIYGDDQDGDGIPDNPDTGTAFGQDDAEFNIFNTDRQLSALQTAVTMLRPLPEQKSLVYFASGLRLNGTDNQAQLRATINAAIRANVVDPSRSTRAAWWRRRRSATRRGRRPAASACSPGQLAQAAMTNFQRSQDTLYALAKDTGGKAMFDYNDLSLGIVQAAEALTSYYILGYYSTHTAADGKFRRVRDLAERRRRRRPGLPPGLLRRQGVRPVHRRRQGASARGSADAGEPDHRDHDRDGGELLPAESRRVLRAGGGEDSRQRAGARPAARRGAHGDRLHRRGEGRVRHHDPERARQAGHQAERRDGQPARDAPDPVRNRLHAAARQVRDQVPGARRETGRIGTYQAAFTIPNLNREEKRVPDQLGRAEQPARAAGRRALQRETEIAADAANPLVHDGQKLIPSVTRVFSKSRDLYVFLQAYQRAATTTQPLVAFVSFYRGDVKAFETAPLAVTDGLDARSKAVPLRFSLPLESIAPGRYECQVTVLDRTARRPHSGGRPSSWFRRSLRTQRSRINSGVTRVRRQSVQLASRLVLHARLCVLRGFVSVRAS